MQGAVVDTTLDQTGGASNLMKFTSSLTAENNIAMIMGIVFVILVCIGGYIYYKKYHKGSSFIFIYGCKPR